MTLLYWNKSICFVSTKIIIYIVLCTVNSKINGTPKDVYLTISKQHYISGVRNLLAHNNITMSYYVQVNSLRLKLNVASKWASKHLWGNHLFCCWLYTLFVNFQSLCYSYAYISTFLQIYIKIIVFTNKISLNSRVVTVFHHFDRTYNLILTFPI